MKSSEYLTHFDMVLYYSRPCYFMFSMDWMLANYQLRLMPIKIIWL